MQNEIKERERFIVDLFNRMMERNYWSLLVKNEIITSTEYNYLFTSVSKNACTQIKYILADMLSYPAKYDRNLSPHNLKITGLLSVAGLQDKNMAFRLLFDEDVYRFVFVRNPLSRLISAFDNKLLLNLNTSWEQSKKDHIENIYTNLATRIKSNVTGLTESTVDLFRNPLTFKEFVYFVVHQDPYEMDRHYYPQHRAMFHDIIKYNLIGRVENFEQDIKVVLGNIIAPAGIYDFAERQNSSSKKLSLDDFYDAELEKLVVKKYEEDFDLFKYPKYQVRPFQSMYVDEKKIEPLTYHQKLNSIEISDLSEKLGIIIHTTGNYTGVRNTVRAIRKRLGPGVNIYIGVRGIESYAFNDFSRYYNAKVYHFENLNISETLNELILKVNEPYVLNLPENMIPPKADRLHSAFKIFHINDNVRVIGGLIEFLPEPDSKEVAKPCLSNSNIILFDKNSQVLVLIPLTYFNKEKYYVDSWEYSFCDTINNVFIADKKIFKENNLWFDNKLKDINHIMLDFFMRIMDFQDINVVELNGMIASITMDKSMKSDAYNLKIKDSSEFFSKWNINQYQVIGKFGQELNEDKNFIFEYPFNYMTCLGQLKEIDQVSFSTNTSVKVNIKGKINHKSDHDKLLNIKELDKEITQLQQELNSLKNSLSWKMTQPLRNIANKLKI